MSILLSIYLADILPSQKGLYMMLGASAIQNSNISTKIVKIMEAKLDSYLVVKEEK